MENWIALPPLYPPLPLPLWTDLVDVADVHGGKVDVGEGGRCVVDGGDRGGLHVLGDAGLQVEAGQDAGGQDHEGPGQPSADELEFNSAPLGGLSLAELGTFGFFKHFLNDKKWFFLHFKKS